MEKFSSVEEILDFAIRKEEEAAEFYTSLADKMKKPAMRKALEEFAREELGHKAKLLEVKKGKLLEPARGKVIALKIADYLADVEPTADLDYAEALTLAMKREKASYKLYMDMASATEDDALRSTLLSLAQEEAKHKLRLEIEYDEHVLAWN